MAWSAALQSPVWAGLGKITVDQSQFRGMPVNTNTTPSAESKPKVNIIGKFQQLPSGVQRLIIGVFVIALLFAMTGLRRLISVEEDARLTEEQTHSNNQA